MSETIALRDHRASVTLDLRVYRLTALQKAAYRLADKVTVAFGEMGDHTLRADLVFDSKVTETEARERVRQFFQEALDQELREKIGEETRDLRALILAHAFSKTDLIRRD